MSTNYSRDVVQRLWSYCNTLRDDGLSYGDSVEQLTHAATGRRRGTSSSRRSGERSWSRPSPASAPWTSPFTGSGPRGRTRPSPPSQSSSCSIPSTAQAYSLNATVVPNGALGYLTIWPTGVSQPGVSTLNAQDGALTSNAAIVPAGTGGAVNAFTTNQTHLLLDINGYFAP